MKKQTLLAGIAAVAMLAGCSKSDDQTISKMENDDIRAVAKSLSIDTSTSPKSKAAYTTTDAIGLKAFVLTSKTTDDYTTAYASGTMTFALAAVGYDSGVTGSKKLPADKSSLFLAALYPATSWSDIATTASYLFNGTQDVMAAPQEEIAKGGTETASFEFAHLLTKFDITVKAENADAATAWGNVTEVKITKVLNSASFKDKVAVTLSTGKAATGTAFTNSASLTSWKTYTNADLEFTAQTVALTTTATSIATTMMAPFAATGVSTDLEVSVTTKTATGSPLVTTVAITVPAGDTQGKQYAINLNFKATDIKGQASVSDWGTVVTIDQDVN